MDQPVRPSWLRSASFSTRSALDAGGQVLVARWRAGRPRHRRATRGMRLPRPTEVLPAHPLITPPVGGGHGSLTDARVPGTLRSGGSGCARSPANHAGSGWLARPPGGTGVRTSRPATRRGGGGRCPASQLVLKAVTASRCGVGEPPRTSRRPTHPPPQDRPLPLLLPARVPAFPRHSTGPVSSPLLLTCRRPPIWRRCS